MENPYVYLVYHEAWDDEDSLYDIFQTKEDAERYISVRDYPEGYYIKRREVKTYQTEFGEG